MGLASFQIAARFDGTADVVVNGQELSDRVRSLHLETTRDNLPRLTLTLIGEGEIAGEGIVYANGPTERVPLGEVVATWLDEIDADELWATASAAYGLDAKPSKLILGALAERARQQLNQDVAIA